MRSHVIIELLDVNHGWSELVLAVCPLLLIHGRRLHQVAVQHDLGRGDISYALVITIEIRLRSLTHGIDTTCPFDVLPSQVASVDRHDRIHS